MGRKRSTAKAGGAKAKASPGARINKIENYEDTLEEGGVDDFMFKRDQMSFNPQNDSDDDDINADQGEEVLGLDLPSKRSKAQDAEEDYDEEEEDDFPQPKQRKDKVKPDLSTKGRFGKEDEDSDEDMNGDDDSASGSEEEEEGWGRQYYSRPSTRREKEKEDVYDEEREEARELEEKEVRRLQRRARETLGGAEDWGLDDVEVEYTAAAEEEVEETAAQVPAPQTTNPAALLRHMQFHEPLKLALARDFPLVVRKLHKTAKGIKKMSKEAEGEESLHKGLGWLHYQTLLTYATTLAFYIHLCALPESERPDMATHPILNRLLQLKQGVAALEDLDFAAGSVSDRGPELFIRPDELGEDDEDDDEEDLQALLQAKRELMARMNEASGKGIPEDEVELLHDRQIAGLEEELGEDSWIDEEDDAQNLWHTAGLEDNELDDLLEDAQAVPVRRKTKEKKRTRGKKGKKVEVVEVDSDEEDSEEAPAGAFTPMAEPEFVSTKSSKKKGKRSASAIYGDEDTLGDASLLADADSEDKERRTKSLRFHTSKIAATSARREAARNRRLGGDDDIPYRDRQAARDAALRRNAPKGASEGEDLDGSEWTDSDRKRAREVREEADEGGEADEGDDGYYDLVKRRKVAKAEAKADAHEEYRESKFAAFADEDETADGPRGLTRAIEKNRGLTPRRSKTGRNPRVKKRIAFEKAKQKVGSQRAVYKGGQAALGGAYSGEKTGISTTVKSRKF